MQPLVNQAVTLSSGTIASLTGLCRYEEIEQVQMDFIGFCEEMQHEFTTWQQAWNVYKIERRTA